MENYNDNWAPVPIYKTVEKLIKMEPIINDKIPENEVRIFFRKTTYFKNGNIYLIMRIPQYNFEEQFSQISSGNWSHKIFLPLKNENFIDFYKTIITVEYMKKTY